MKVAPVSGDLVVTLALSAVALGVIAYLVKKASDKLPSVQQVEDSLNPTKDTNLAYRGVNALGNAVASTEPDAAGRNADGSWNIGAWVSDLVTGNNEKIAAMLKGGAPPAPAVNGYSLDNVGAMP